MVSAVAIAALVNYKAEYGSKDARLFMQRPSDYKATVIIELVRISAATSYDDSHIGA